MFVLHQLTLINNYAYLHVLPSPNNRMAEKILICLLCGIYLAAKKLYCLRDSGEEEEKKLHHQLKDVISDVLPPFLISDFVCVSCRGSVVTVWNQKDRFEQSKWRIVAKISGLTSPSVSYRSQALSTPILMRP